MQPSFGSGSLLKRAMAVYFVCGISLWLITTTPAYAATPVHIDFDNLPTNTIVNYQYPQVTFSSENVYSYPPFIYTNCGNCVTSSYPNYITSGVGYGNGNHEVILAFNQPVKNLTFYTVGGDNFGTIARIDIWENGNYARTVSINGVGYSYYPIFTDLRQYGNNITKIRIYNIIDVNGLGFDDFDFTPVDVERVDITSGRVSGVLNNSTQNALLGADVALQANIFPSNLSGGTYSWSATGPSQQVSATNTNSSYTVRWTEAGTYQAKVTYTRNGIAVSATVNVNVVVPILDSFTANQYPSVVSNGCEPSYGTNSHYILGCENPSGIRFSSDVHIPSGSYLSDNSDAGVKYVQRANSLRKQLNGEL